MDSVQRERESEKLRRAAVRLAADVGCTEAEAREALIQARRELAGEVPQGYVPQIHRKSTPAPRRRKGRLQ